jgi:choline dehydrogenase-like flavoprotein
VIEDLHKLPADTVFDADLCIVGAGAAGITLAMQFANSPVKVVVLEGGGIGFEPDSQALYEGENVGLARLPMVRSRLKMFGGTTNHWGGRCAPLNPIDFQQRSWVPHSGWPIGRADLDPYYARAIPVCDLAPPPIDEEQLRTWLGIPDPKLDKEKLGLHHWMLSPPTRFGSKYLGGITAAKNITVVLHANVTNLQTNPASSRLEHIDASTIDGKKARFRAKRFALCCGGIENARLLLMSNGVQNVGVGNRKDLVGRFFQEHTRSWQIAIPTRTPFALKKIYNIYSSKVGAYLVGLSMTEGFQVKERLLNCSAMTFFDNGEFSSSDAAMRLIRASLGQAPEQHAADDTWSVLSDLDHIIMSVRAKYLLSGTRWSADESTTLVVETEQCPNPDSRISLSTERDVLGLPKVKVDWRLTELDRLSSSAMFKLLAAHWGETNQARVRIPEWLVEDRADWATNFKDVSHHIGTTRMADSAELGVVDRNCKVHEVDNLYVGGASVFTTSGHVNPTFTIVALAIRLADHLKGLPQ